MHFYPARPHSGKIIRLVIVGLLLTATSSHAESFQWWGPWSYACMTSEGFNCLSRVSSPSVRCLLASAGFSPPRVSTTSLRSHGTMAENEDLKQRVRFPDERRPGENENPK